MPLTRFDNETLLQGKSFAEFYIVFTRSQVHIPFIDQAFSHCYAMKWDGYNWMALYPALGYTDMHILPQYDEDIRAILADTGYTDIIQVSAWRSIKRWRSPLPVPFTCVEQVKALLGISAWWIITPKQLYKYLGGTA